MHFDDKADELQEFRLGRLIFLHEHPEHAKAKGLKRLEPNLKGYRRMMAYRIRQMRWQRLRAQSLIESMIDADYDLDFEAMLIREILRLLPLAVRKETLMALASDDGRRIRKAARLIRETIPDVIHRMEKEEKVPENVVVEINT